MRTRIPILKIQEAFPGIKITFLFFQLHTLKNNLFFTLKSTSANFITFVLFLFFSEKTDVNTGLDKGLKLLILPGLSILSTLTKTMGK